MKKIKDERNEIFGLQLNLIGVETQFCCEHHYKNKKRK